MGVTHISSVGEARRLATELNSQSRTRPCVVVSTPAGRPSPYIDANAIFEEVGDLAPVYVLPTGQESWAFSKAMPHLTQVYGGAGRAYPVGTSWVVDPYQAPLRFAFDAREGVKATQVLIADALRMSSDAGLLARSTSTPVRIEAEVKSLVLPTRAIVRTHDGQFASICLELLFPDAEVEQVFRPGMRLRGDLDPETRRYDVSSMLLPAERALSGYLPGDVVLAKVVETGPERAKLQLHPQVETTVVRDDVTSNDLDLVSSLMSAGEVLAARVVETGPRWRLSLLDVDDDEEAKQAPSLLEGGPPWLAPPVPAPPVPEPSVEVLEQLPVDGAVIEEIGSHEVDAPAHPPPTASRAPSPLLFDRNRRTDHPAVVAETTLLRRERDKAVSAKLRAEQHNARLLRDLADLRGERQLLHNELERVKLEKVRLQSQLRRSKTDLRKARQQAQRTRPAADVDRRFVDREEDFRHDVYLAWVSRVPAAEKGERPLPAYRIGPDFLSTVDAIQGIDRSKIVDVVVEVVTGLAEHLQGREMHPLREHENGDAPAVVREDGATCWRVALQVNSPQARRLHFWRMRDGEVELSRVTLHDDFTP